MTGNVNEWCYDWHGTVNAGTETDPTGPVEGDDRVLRGGAWNSYGYDSTVSKRSFYDPFGRFGYFGFRVARSK